MRMYLVEVFEGVRQLRQHRGRVAQVHAGHVVALERVDELYAMLLLCLTGAAAAPWAAEIRPMSARCTRAGD